jgi:lipopolysaccharide cholinephosphotransferase
MVRLSTFSQFKKLQNDNLITPTDDQLKQLQNVLLMVTNDIATYCDSNGIRYQLGGGSVLGAMRHKGFIPWDDDVDLNMPRKDYDRFMVEFAKNFSEKYWVHSLEHTPGYRSWGGRIRLKGTALKDREDIYSNECGVWVDIFPIENTYDNAAARWFHGVISDFYGLICSCTRTNQDFDYYLSLAEGNDQLRKSLRLKARIGKLFSFRSYNAWMRASEKWFSRCKNERSKYVTVPSGRRHFFGELRLRSELVPTRFEQFEGYHFRVPLKAEEYLDQLFGDWRQIPNAEDQEHHAFFAFDLGKYAEQTATSSK